MFRSDIVFSKDGLAVSIISLFSIIWLTTFLLHLDPLVFPDSKSYLDLADNIRHWNWTGFHFRTPGYPLFLAFVQSITGSENALYPAILQVIMTATIPLILYGIFRIASGNVVIGFMASLVFYLDWAGQLMSVAILTETVSQFLLLISILGAAIVIKAPTWKKSLILSVLLFMLIMVRPAFLPLGITYSGVLFLYCLRRNMLSRAALTSISIIFIVPLLLTAIWGVEVKRETGKYALSHITGIALLNQVTEMIPTVTSFSQDPELLAFLKEKVDADEGLNSGWEIVIDRGKTTKSLEWETASEIKKLSVMLILDYPRNYIHKVVENGREYWVDTATYVFMPSETSKWFSGSTLGRLLIDWTNAHFWMRPGRMLFVLLMMCILTITHLALPGIRAEAKACTALCFSSIAVCMITHIAVNGADLARYRMPVQTLYLAYLVYLICGIFLGIKSLMGRCEINKKI